MGPEGTALQKADFSLRTPVQLYTTIHTFPILGSGADQLNRYRSDHRVVEWGYGQTPGMY